MSLFHSLVRGYRRLAAHLAAPKTCPICLDELPMLGLQETKPRDQRQRRLSASRRSDEQAEDSKPTFAKLWCKHKFCTDCIKQYTNMKIQAKEVDDDQLVCPVVTCKVWLCERDIKLICGEAAMLLFQKTLQRKRDEKNPSARWCPRRGCEELIMCESMDNFTCPKCKTVGCFRCRGYAHRFWFSFCTMKEEDSSYLEWEKSLGDRQAVRPCPQCKIRIWKAEGCNHIKCTGCRFEFCWSLCVLRAADILGSSDVPAASIPRAVVPADAADRGRDLRLWRQRIHHKLRVRVGDRDIVAPLAARGSKSGGLKQTLAALRNLCDHHSSTRKLKSEKRKPRAIAESTEMKTRRGSILRGDTSSECASAPPIASAKDMQAATSKALVAFVAQTTPTQIPLESPGKPELSVPAASSRFRALAPTGLNVESKRAPFVTNVPSPADRLLGAKDNAAASLSVELKRAPPFVKKVANPADKLLGAKEKALQSSKAPVGTPRFSLKSTIPAMQKCNKENPDISRRMNFTVSSSSGGASLKQTAPKPGNPNLPSTVVDKLGRDPGNLFKSSFGKSAFSMKLSGIAGKEPPKTLTLSSAEVSTALKKRTLTQFQSGKFSLTTKSTQPQTAFSLKPQLQATLQSSNASTLLSRTDNATKSHATSLAINKSGGRPFALGGGNGSLRTSLLSSGAQKKTMHEAKMPTKMMLHVKKSTTLGATAAPALISPSRSSSFQRTAQVKPVNKLSSTGLSPHVIPFTGEDGLHGGLEPVLKKLKPNVSGPLRLPAEDPRQRFDPSQEDDFEELDVDQIDVARDDDVVERIKNVQDFIDEVSKEQSSGANRILDMDVTLSECLLDIVTDLIAEEGEIGLHKVCMDAEVDCELLSRMMECHGVDEY